MSGHYVGHVDGAHRAYRQINGIYRLYEGPTFDSPRAAARYVDAIDAPATPATDEPDLTDGFWGAVERGDGVRRSPGSPAAALVPRHGRG